MVISVGGGCTHTSADTHLWAHPHAHYMLGYTPPCPLHAGIPPPPLWAEGMTHICENIIFPQVAGGKYFIQQECIPVGCIPFAAVTICWGVSASVHAGIHPRAWAWTPPGHGPGHPTRHGPGNPPGMGLDTPLGRHPPQPGPGQPPPPRTE